MSDEKERVRIELTSEQRALVKEQTGKEVPSVELAVEQLEERIAPESVGFSFCQIRPTYNP